MRGRAPWGNQETLIETQRTRPQKMREHDYPIVCLSANSDSAGSASRSRNTRFASCMASFLVDQLDLCGLSCPTVIIPPLALNSLCQSVFLLSVKHHLNDLNAPQNCLSSTTLTTGHRKRTL